MLNKKTGWYMVIIGCFLAIGLMGCLGNNLSEFKEKAEEDLIDAKEYYQVVMEDISGEEKQEFKNDVEEYLKEVINSVKNDFKDNNVTEEEARDILSDIDKFDIMNKELLDARRYINNLSDSRDSFEEGKEYLEGGSYIKAIDSFSGVIEKDENYDRAKELIEKTAPKAEQNIDERVENYKEDNEYDLALEVLRTASQYFPNGGQYDDEIKRVEDLKELQRIEKLKEKQKVEVESKRVEERGFIYNHAYITVRNNHDEVVENMRVGIVMYDRDGYPVSKRYDNTNLQFGRSDSPNIQPGETWGHNNYWHVEIDTAEVRACVQEVDFYDGSSWQNDYFNEWREKYERTPLHEIE